MKDKLVFNIFSSAGQTIVQTLILLMLYRYLINRIGVDQIGIWSIVGATASVARISELGLGGSIVKFIATYRASGDDQAAAESLQTATISVGVLLAIIVAIGYPLLVVALPFVLPAEGLIAGQIILPYSLVSLWLNSVAGMWMNSLDACFQSGLRAAIMILGSVLFFFSAMVGVKLYGIVGLATAQVAQGVFLIATGWVAIRRAMPLVPILPNHWKILRFREMLGYGLNFQINSIVALLFEPTAKILFGRFGGLHVAGYFEMSQRMVMSVRALLIESNRVIVPVYAGMTSYKTDAPELYVQNLRNLLFLVIPVFAALMALTPAICEVWVGSFQAQFVIMGGLLTFAWFLNTVFAPAYFAYLGQGKLRWITIGHVAMGATNILAGFYLGKFFGWAGVLLSFTGALVLGSFIPAWAYHYENQILNRNLFLGYDVFSAGVCFTAALLTLTGYWAVLDASILDKWARLTIFTFIIAMVSLAMTWFHPLRKKLLTMTTSMMKFQ
jgi:O-antigen/teichoic acid export membrane protein